MGAIGRRFYQEEQISLNDYVGTGNDSVLVRFRFLSDDQDAGPGWYIDDVRILTNPAEVSEKIREMPKNVQLYENYPNPFNSATRILYTLPEDSQIKLSIFDILGKEIKILYNGAQIAGDHNILWDGKDSENEQVASGVYIYKLTVGNVNVIRKLLYLK